MARRTRLASRLATTALALALAFASSLTCVAGALGASHESELRACCMAMGHDCGSAITRLDRDCCAAMSPALAGLIPLAPDLAVPAADAVTAPIADDVPLISAFVPSRPERTVRGSPDTPTYLLVSVFRL